MIKKKKIKTSIDFKPLDMFTGEKKTCGEKIYTWEKLTAVITEEKATDDQLWAANFCLWLPTVIFALERTKMVPIERRL